MSKSVDDRGRPGMRQARSLVGACLLPISLALGLLGCQRRAPGPDECEAFAEAVVADAVNHAVADSPLLRSEALARQVQLRIDQETQECLTRPYDRELLLCVLATKQARVCLSEFRRRKGANK